MIGGIYFAMVPFAGMWWLAWIAPNTFLPLYGGRVNTTVGRPLTPE